MPFCLAQARSEQLLNFKSCGTKKRSKKKRIGNRELKKGMLQSSTRRKKRRESVKTELWSNLLAELLRL